MLFFALEAAIFLAGTVLPTVVHLAFLPLAYAISETAGLNTLLLWISYYVALAFVRGRVPSIATHLLSMLSPVIALLPIAHLLLGSLHPSLASAALPFTAALDSALARQLIRSVIQFTPPVLAVVEGLATVFVVKLIGRVMQTSVDEDDRPKVAIPLLAGTALALYQFYSLYTLLSDPQLRSVVLNVFGLCVAAMLAMVLLLQPGENDAPGAEALLLTMYATFVLTTAISPSSSVVDTIPVLRSGAAAAYQQASFGAKAMSLIQSLLSRPPSPSTPSSAPFLTRLASALSALLARLPWWTAVSLVYRGLVLGAVGAVLLDTNMDDGDDTESAASTVGETLLAVAAGLFTRPLVLLYYGRVIMEAFGYIRGTSTEIAVWLSVGTALVTQLALVVWRSRD